MDIGTLGSGLDVWWEPDRASGGATAEGRPEARVGRLRAWLLSMTAGNRALSGARERLQSKGARGALPRLDAATLRLLKFGVELGGRCGPEDLARHLAMTLACAGGAQGAAVYLPAEAGGGYRLAASAGGVAAPALLGDSGVNQSPGTAESVADEMPRPANDCHGSTTPICWLPLASAGELRGLVALADSSFADGPDEFGEALIQGLLAQAAIALRADHWEREAARKGAELAALQRQMVEDRIGMRVEPRQTLTLPYIIGASAALRRGLALVERTAPSDASILIIGETGTGKELVARAIHELSPRRHGPLVSVNCPAIPGSLAESELFGHERGAFTDALAARPGKFELAEGGTVFLDEVADLPLDIQAKLLRVLQERECQRVGGSQTRKLDIRVVAATNRDLRAAVRAGRFREDLYYRLAAVEVVVPPLRERAGDVPMLASHFLERANSAHDNQIAGFTMEAMTALSGYDWPGNVRELRHVVERAALLCGAEVIRPEDLGVLGGADSGQPRFGDTMRQEKARRIQDALAQSGGNQAAAARLLGISRSNLGRTMKSLGIWQPVRRRPALASAGSLARSHRLG